MYNKQEEKQRKVQSASDMLQRYVADVNDVSAGNMILYYVDEGLYKIASEHEQSAVSMMTSWGIRNVQYLWLRMAHKGMLEVVS